MRRINKTVFKVHEPTFLVYNGKNNETLEFTLIDPGYKDVHKVLGFLETNNAVIKYVFFTHGHSDHVARYEDYAFNFPEMTTFAHKTSFLTRVADLFVKTDTAQQEGCKYTFAPFLKSQFGACFVSLKDQEDLDLGGKNYRVLHTPGHTRGEVLGVPGDDISVLVDNVLFTGDILCHAMSIPQFCDFNYSNSVKKLLDEQYDWVCPGHGRVMRADSAKRKMNLLITVADAIEDLSLEFVENMREEDKRWVDRRGLWKYSRLVYVNFFNRLANDLPHLRKATLNQRKIALNKCLIRLNYALNCAELKKQATGHLLP